MYLKKIQREQNIYSALPFCVHSFLWTSGHFLFIFLLQETHIVRFRRRVWTLKNPSSQISQFPLSPQEEQFWGHSKEKRYYKKLWAAGIGREQAEEGFADWFGSDTLEL